LLVIFGLMNLRKIAEVTDRLNAIAFHVRVGTLVENNTLKCSVCGRYYPFKKFVSHLCVYATSPISDIQTVVEKLRQKTNGDFSRFKHMTFEEAYNEWFENNNKKSVKNN